MSNVTELKFEHKGLDCEGILLDGRHRCGYVTVPKGHVLHGAHYDDPNIDIHGGLTYSEASDEGWKFGFDCGHCYDTLESCDVAYVKVQCMHLAQQLANYKIKETPLSPEKLKEFFAENNIVTMEDLEKRLGK